MRNMGNDWRLRKQFKRLSTIQVRSNDFSKGGSHRIERREGSLYVFWNYSSFYESHICNMAIKVFILTFSLQRTTTKAMHVCIFFKLQNA